MDYGFATQLFNYQNEVATAKKPDEDNLSEHREFCSRYYSQFRYNLNNTMLIKNLCVFLQYWHEVIVLL